MYITKKELLVETGISYGQLYRWKREGLIPEEWFIKRPSKTGQETLLPKELVTERIQFIKENKGKKSIEEMAAMLSIHSSEKEFNGNQLRQIKEIHPDVLRLIKDGEYSRAEVALLVIASDLQRNYHATKPEMNELLAGCAGFFDEMPEGRHLFLALRAGNRLFGLICAEQAEPVFDKRIQIVHKYQLEELASQLAMKYLHQE